MSPLLPRPWVMCSNERVLSKFSWSIHRCCSATICFCHRPLLPAQQVTAPSFSFQRDIWFISQQSTHHFVGLPDGNTENTSVIVKTNEKNHLLFTWGVLCIFWVLARRGVAVLEESATVEDLDAVIVWNLFLSTLPAWPCNVWGLGGSLKTRSVDLSLGLR